MRLLYYTGGLSGSGHIVSGLAIAAALKRASIHADFRILSAPNDFCHLAATEHVDFAEIPVEGIAQLGSDGWQTSALYAAIADWQPDIVVADLHWFALDAMLDSLPCRKAILFRQVAPHFFTISLPDRQLRFRPEAWDLVLATEPGFSLPFSCQTIEPLIIRNRDEILPANQARHELGLAKDAQTCLFPFNGHSHEAAEAWNNFSYLEDEGWTVYRSENRQGGLFPAVSWFNAFDLLVCGAGYNAFWEARYFEKEAYFVSFPRRFEDQDLRIARCGDYTPRENGADQLVRRFSIYDKAVPALLLGLVQAAVGPREPCFRMGGVGQQGGSDRDGNGRVQSVYPDAGGETLHQIAADRLQAGTVNVGQQDHEFVAAVAEGHIAAADASGYQSAGRF